MVISLHFTLLTRCVREIEVPDDFSIKCVKTQKVYEELCRKLPDENLSEIEDEEVYDFVSQDFGQVDGVQLMDETNGIIKEYFGNKLYSITLERKTA